MTEPLNGRVTSRDLYDAISDLRAEMDRRFTHAEDKFDVRFLARVGGRQRFEMVSEADPSMRTGFDGRFDEVVHNALLSSRGAWDGIPGQAGAWPSNLRREFHHDDGRTRLVVREGPHPPGTADLGRQAWEMMLPKLESLLSG
jgi:hypothetical protein